jgi:hypothetical protein
MGSFVKGFGNSLGVLFGSPPDPGAPPKPPDPADEAVKNARLMERRKQLGLQGRMSTFLTTAQSDQPQSAPAAQSTLLGG